MTRELGNTKESVKKEIDMLKGEIERTKSELAETKKCKRKSDLDAASELDAASDLDVAKTIYICPSDNTVDLRTLLSRMKCLEV